MSEQQTISTNQLLEEIADLSARLNQIRPGIGALVYCPRCWKPPYMHKGGTIKGCKSKDKWPVDQFTNDLLRQRNNLIAVIKSAKTEAKQTEAIDVLQTTVEKQAQTIESYQERLKSLQDTKEVILHLLKNLNEAYLGYMTGGEINEMKRIFSEVDDLLVSFSTDPKSSSEGEDDDEGDEEPSWDHCGDRTQIRWPTSNALPEAAGAALFPSTEGSTIISNYGEAGATQNATGADKSGQKRVNFTFPPVIKLSSGASDQPSAASNLASGASGQTSADSNQNHRITGGILKPSSPTRSVHMVQNLPASTHSLTLPAPAPAPAPSASYAQPAGPPPPPAPQYPGLFEKPGVVLIFMTGGTLCGGEADGDKVVRAAKLIKTDFREHMDALAYLEQRRKFVDQLSCYFGSEHMYTLCGIFSLSAHVFYKTFSPIFKHESRFTSFMSFIYEFEHSLFPSLDSIALGRLHKRVQQKNESVGDYFTDFADLIFVIGRNEEDYQQQFLSGLANKSTQYTVSNTIYPEGTRTLRKLADHARHVEAQAKLNRAFRGTDDNSNETRNISTLNNTGG